MTISIDFVVDSRYINYLYKQLYFILLMLKMFKECNVLRAGLAGIVDDDATARIALSDNFVKVVSGYNRRGYSFRVVNIIISLSKM